MRLLGMLLLSGIAVMAAIGGGGGVITTFTNGTAEVDTFNTTAVTQRIDTYSVELKARLQGGAFLYDQTFSVPFGDPTVQYAITAARAVLAGAGAVSFTGPTQLSNSQSQVSTTTNSILTGPPVTQLFIGAADYVGPFSITIGTRGICQNYTLAPLTGAGSGLVLSDGNYYLVSGCQTAQTFSVDAGTLDTDQLTLTVKTTPQTTTTTNTFLTTQVYELDGFRAGIAPTPAPPALLLTITALAVAGLFLLRRKSAV